jgi:hypothetical protein
VSRRPAGSSGAIRHPALLRLVPSPLADPKTPSASSRTGWPVYLLSRVGAQTSPTEQTPPFAASSYLCTPRARHSGSTDA